jgi:PAS domain-containing protein
MIKICSYCEKFIEGEPDEAGRITHGMCPECFQYFDRQLEGLDFSAYLDQFPQPIAVIDADARVLYLNSALAQLLGKNKEEYLGMRGGEVMECMFARLPQGCGNTEHCPACTVRRTVMQAMSTGEPLKTIPATLSQPGRKLDLRISARKEGEVVYLQIDDLKAITEAGLVKAD